MSPKLRLIQKSSSSLVLCADKWLPEHQLVQSCQSHTAKPAVRATSTRIASNASLADKFARLRVSASDPFSRSASSFASFKAKTLNGVPWRPRDLVTSTVSAMANNQTRSAQDSASATTTSSSSQQVSLRPSDAAVGGGTLSSVNRALEQMVKQVPMLLSTVSSGLVDIWKSRMERGISVEANQPKSNGKASESEEEQSVEVKVGSKTSAPKLPTMSKASLDALAGSLVQNISIADSNMAHYTRIEELGRFLRRHPEAQAVVTKVGAVRQLMLAKQGSADPSVHEAAYEVLALLGYCRPPSGWGVRILSIDGGGLRGIMALEILHQLEELTGQPVHRLFDYICGVSTGAVLAVLLGALKSTVPRCEELYRQIGAQIFTQNTIWGTGKLVMSHAFFDTDNWTRLVREHIGERLLSETPRDPTCPKFSAISAVVSRPRMEAFLFRNYEYPPRVRSVYPGTNAAHLWQAVRASAAAPGYFEEFPYADEIHQDGGILINNPTALALHECKQLWPGEAVQCVISLGSGRYEPQQASVAQKHTGLKDKVMKIIDSATDTEAVHTILHDLLPPNVYFRINPYLSENIPLHEARSEKILKLQEDARMYLRRNESKLKMAAALLQQPRGRLQRAQDFLSLKSNIYFG